MELKTITAMLMCVVAGTVGGVFFAFSTFVMQALAQLPPAQGIAAMQRINVVVLNLRFLGMFIGGALLAVACVVVAMVEPVGRHALLAAGLTYLAGAFAVTIAFNVPRNERLGRLQADSGVGTGYWDTYLREWTRWNHVRTVASMASSACAAASLALG